MKEGKNHFYAGSCLPAYFTVPHSNSKHFSAFRKKHQIREKAHCWKITEKVSFYIMASEALENAKIEKSNETFWLIFKPCGKVIKFCKKLCRLSKVPKMESKR